MRSGAISVCLVILTGCATSSGGTRAEPLRFDTGNSLPRASLALLHTREPPGFRGPAVRLIKINDIRGPNRLGYGNGGNGTFYVDLAPGKYSLLVGYHNLIFVTGRTATQVYGSLLAITFAAEAGHEYVLDTEVSADDHWQPTLFDATIQKPVHWELVPKS
jgi:hypothetical protein